MQEVTHIGYLTNYVYKLLFSGIWLLLKKTDKTTHTNYKNKQLPKTNTRMVCIDLYY